MVHKLGGIWEEEHPTIAQFPWRMQLVNYVAQFATKEAAERYWAATEKIRTDRNR
jgi:hypothetical protein